MLSALDYAIVAFGTGWLLACTAWAYKLVVDTRRNGPKPTGQRASIVPAEVAVNDDIMAHRLNEIQRGRFAKPMHRP